MVYAGLWFCELPGFGKGEEGRRVPSELSEENGHEVDPFLTARFVSIRLRRWQKPALAAGLIEMTTPDKPRSRLQRYRITPVGEAALDKEGEK
jgi:hypothetical protein